MSYIFSPKKGTTWRRFVVKNLASDVILNDKVITSPFLARSLDKLLSKLINWAKTGTLHTRRLALSYLNNKKHLGVIEKLFSNLGKKYKERPGGYTRTTKLFCRRGDNSLRVCLSLV